MPRGRPESILPLAPRPKRIPFRRPIEHLLRRDRLLAGAYADARARFAMLPGVCGIGIGRPFSEQTGRYRAEALAIKVSVVAKRSGKELPRKERIPRTLSVERADTGRTASVPVDVVEAGVVRQSSDERPLPSSRLLRVGRLFAFRVPTPDAGELLPFGTPLGTVGAILRARNGSTFAVSAGHVFVDTCGGMFDAPRQTTALGCDGRTWHRVPAASYSPPTIRPGILVEDCLTVRTPAALTAKSGFGWPPGFVGEVVENDDVTHALASGGESGFVWVERGAGVPTRIPIDLESDDQPFDATVDCRGSLRRMRHGFVWRCRFTSPASTTVGGDSGAPVFLTTPHGPRLLGFHFFESLAQPVCYSCDARLFFRRHVGELNEHFSLPHDE